MGLIVNTPIELIISVYRYHFAAISCVIFLCPLVYTFLFIFFTILKLFQSSISLLMSYILRLGAVL